MLRLRQRSGTIALFTVAIFATAGPSADGSWSTVGASTAIDGTKPLAAGNVTGTVGILSPLNHTNTANSCQTTGDVGAKWNGTQYSHADDSKQATVLVMHEFRRDSPGAATLTFTQSSTITISGTAHQYQFGGWWWNSVNQVSEWVLGEALDRFGQVIATTTTWSVHTEAKATGGDAGNQPPHPGPYSSNNNNNTVPPASTSQFDTTQPLTTNGSSSGSIQLPDVPGARCRAYVSFDCQASGCVDNAVVSNDELKLSFTFQSSV